MPVAARQQTLLSVMAANNETGVLQPLDDIAEIAARAEITLHSDMVQAFGKTAMDFAGSGIGYASLSAHKIGGAAGTGAVIVPGLGRGAGCTLQGAFFGGGQEHGYRVGTENLAGIAGFGAAAKAALSSPCAMPVPIIASPIFFMMVSTSAKSKLIIP